MAADLPIYEGSYRQAVEAIGGGFPWCHAVASLVLIIEAIDAVDAGILVVSTEQEEVFWVLDLIGQQQADGLQ